MVNRATGWPFAENRISGSAAKRPVRLTGVLICWCPSLGSGHVVWLPHRSAGLRHLAFAVRRVAGLPATALSAAARRRRLAVQ